MPGIEMLQTPTEQERDWHMVRSWLGIGFVSSPKCTLIVRCGKRETERQKERARARERERERDRERERETKRGSEGGRERKG